MFPEHVYESDLTTCCDDIDSIDQSDKNFSGKQISDSLSHDFFSFSSYTRSILSVTTNSFLSTY